MADIDISSPTDELKTGNFLRALTGDGKIVGVTCKEFTLDPPSVGTGADGSTTVTYPGAKVGDLVLLIPPYDTQETMFQGQVSAADTIECMFYNTASGTINLASGTWKALVFHCS